jgi:mannosyltransferase OCH1-like enzyme
MDLSIPWIRDNIQLISEIPISKIPLKFHLIWIGDNPLPEYGKQNYEAWKRLMPHWEGKLWTNEDVQEFPEEVISKINQAEKGAQKADILRYYIIEKYGGFYIDTDIVPIRALDPLLYLGNDIVLYHDNSLTWPYIINNFFGACPHHPVLQETCKRVLCVELNTPDVNFKTGPFLWGTVVCEVPPPYGKRYALLNYPFFSNFHNPPDKFGTHTYAKTWVQ